MTDTELDERIEAASAYEALHVPSLFGAWAEPVLDAAGLAEGERVLDVACGTGVLARAAVRRVGIDGLVAGLDPDPGMLAVAERKESGVEWTRGTAEELPWGNGAFDVVASQFGLMFFRDRKRALREMLRVLARGGRLVVAVWGPLEASPGYTAEVELLERLAGPEAANALRAPFVLGDRDELARLFEEAGAAPVEIETLPGTTRFPSLRTMVEADLRGWLPVLGVHLEEEVIQRILDEAEGAMRPHAREAEGAVFDVTAHVARTGRRS